MNREEALSVLNAKLDEYRRMTYAELAAKVGDEDIAEVVGPSGTAYQVEILVTWDHKPNGDVRVLGSIDDGKLYSAIRPLCSDILVAADDQGR